MYQQFKMADKLLKTGDGAIVKVLKWCICGRGEGVFWVMEGYRPVFIFQLM